MPRLRTAAALASIALAGAGLASCSDRESENKGNKGDQPSGTVQTNPSTLQSTGTVETTTTQAGSGSVTTQTSP